jgi:hypothetical protein
VTNSAGEPIEANWTSEDPIRSVVVKSGTDECLFPGGTSGVVTSCGPPPGQQSRSSPADGDPTRVILLGVAGATIFLADRRQNRSGEQQSNREE